MSGKSKRRRNARAWSSALDWMRWHREFVAEHGREPTLLDTLKRAWPQRQIDWSSNPIGRSK